MIAAGAHARGRQAGVTIIELMIALTLGLLITAGVGSLYLQGSRSYSQDDRYQRMVENGRFAVDQIARDLRMLSFWGEMLDPAAVTTALTAGEDCGVDVFDGSTAIRVNFNTDSPAVTQFDMASGSCTSITGGVVAGTNQIAIKHTSGVALGSGQEDDQVYVRTNGASGSFIQYEAGVTPAPPTSFSDWAYTPSVYYIRNEGGSPFLCRLRLDGLAFAAVGSGECLAEGVEQLYVQFGLDTDSDGVANQYRANPSAAEMAQVVTARVYLLVRAPTADPLYENTKSYALGDLSIAAPNDGFYRRVFSTTLRLRNPANLAALN
ncbi:MAG: PilW family protein [Gammaproteobacteria bacterium]